MSPAPRGETPLPPEELRRVVEAILFAHDGPVTIEMMIEALTAEAPESIREAIAALGRQYDEAGHAFEIVRIAGGHQICTRERYANWVARFQRGNRKVRLSRAAVETLAIIAYRQPITRTAMEEIRGVDSGAVLHTLLERNLITVKGRSKGIGRPLLYATTSDFLEYFGLDRIEDLPRLDEIESLLKEREESPAELLGLGLVGEGAAAEGAETAEAADLVEGVDTAGEVTGTGESAPADRFDEELDPDLDSELDPDADEDGWTGRGIPADTIAGGPGLFRPAERPAPDPAASPVGAPTAGGDLDDASIDLERIE